ncbi:hypothetical protein [Fusobacterium ulcerans]|uniref:hypothetical protein n=1 Tax=Fusobacterium ulcerans TaxID=861 RepID=UPI002E75E2AF|nr:hypothetical protein [Fusobacterium ulcerans]MEE0138988.1 hypothetical protein [Fusobacterium ulcerans]
MWITFKDDSFDKKLNSIQIIKKKVNTDKIELITFCEESLELLGNQFQHSINKKFNENFEEIKQKLMEL